MSDERKVAVASPIALLKACKNAAEIAGMRNAHVRAGAFPSFLRADVPAQMRLGRAHAGSRVVMLRCRLDRAAPHAAAAAVH